MLFGNKIRWYFYFCWYWLWWWRRCL